MKSPTDAFEDAEIAREEGMTPRAALLRAADLTGETSVANWLKFHARMPIYDSPGRQSPASTTAADATDPIPRYAQLDVWMALGGDSRVFENGWRDERTFANAWADLMGYVRAIRAGIPTRVAAPEGDGGNE